MSRCIPFPPPGYVWQGVSGDALRELIEVRREKAEAEKKKRKRKRKNKKEKRRKRQEVEELEEGEIGWRRKSHHRSHKRLESRAVGEHGDCQINWEHDSQGLERSCLTEEFDVPSIECCLLMQEENVDMKNPGWSPESFLGHGLHNDTTGSTISFAMVQTMRDDQEPLFDKPVCLATRMKIAVQEKFELANHHSEYQFSSSNSEPDRASRELCHSSASSESSKNDKTELVLKSRYYGSESEYIESTYRELFVNWIPPSMKCMQPESEDLDWLFGKKAKRADGADMIEMSHPRSHNWSCNSSVFYPKALYLPQAGTYALPLTIPF